MDFATLSVQDAFIHASGLKSTNTMPAGWRIAGNFSAREIVRAVQAVVDGQPALRTRILQAPDGSYQQRVGGGGVARIIERVDLRGGDADAAMSQLINEYLAHTFDLTRAPLWRAFLARVDRHEWVLGIAFAHVLIDGASVAVFSRNLADALAGARRPSPIPLGALAAAERKIRPNRQQAGWWRKQYARRSGLAAEWDGKRAEYRVHPVPVIAPDVVEGLKRLAAAAGASISTTLGAVASVAAVAVLECRNPMLGFTSGQRNPQNQGTVGPLHDHLPVLAGTAMHVSFADLVRNLHQRRAAARDHRLPSALLSQIAGAVTPYDLAINYSPFAASVPHKAGDRGTVTARPIPTIGRVFVYRATSVAPVAAAILRPRGDAAVTGDITGISALLSDEQLRDVGRVLAAVAQSALRHPTAAIGALVARA